MSFCPQPRLRAQTTAEIVAEYTGFSREIDLRSDLYHAAPEECIHALQEVDEAHLKAMVIGHNPGLEDLLEQLTGKIEFLPTAALAVVELSIRSWQELQLGTSGKLVHVWRPKEI